MTESKHKQTQQTQAYTPALIQISTHKPIQLYLQMYVSQMNGMQKQT